jgi:hypothetical protein
MAPGSAGEEERRQSIPAPAMACLGHRGSHLVETKRKLSLAILFP